MMADDKQEPERMDAPNQQAVGQPPPWEQGTGGQAGDPAAHVEETKPGDDAPDSLQDAAGEPHESEQDPKAKRTERPGRKAEK